MDVVYCIFNVFQQYVDIWKTTIAHIFILGAIAITVATFETAKRKPRVLGGYYTPSRSRAIYYQGKRIELDPNDKGGEHE